MHSSGWAPLSWPPVVMTLVGSATHATMPQDAAELAYLYIDASYRSTDSRELDEHGGLPGVTREYRQTVSKGNGGEIDYANAGIEGYGWGALSVHLLLRYLVGLRAEERDLITVAPAFPQILLQPGATYRLESLPWGKYLLNIEYVVNDEKNYHLYLRCFQPVEEADADTVSLSGAETQCDWEGIWGEEHMLQLPQLTRSSVNQR